MRERRGSTVVDGLDLRLEIMFNSTTAMCPLLPGPTVPEFTEVRAELRDRENDTALASVVLQEMRSQATMLRTQGPEAVALWRLHLDDSGAQVRASDQRTGQEIMVANSTTRLPANGPLGFSFLCMIVRSLRNLAESECAGMTHASRMNFLVVAVRNLCTGRTRCCRYF